MKTLFLGGSEHNKLVYTDGLPPVYLIPKESKTYLVGTSNRKLDFDTPVNMDCYYYNLTKLALGNVIRSVYVCSSTEEEKTKLVTDFLNSIFDSYIKNLEASK